MYGGRIFELTAHSQRLRDSARQLDFEIPWTVEEIDRACLETCARNGLTDAYVRPIAWRGSETMGVSALEARIHLSIAAWSWPSYFDADQRARGVRLTW